MKANPALKKLGYSETDRLVIIHADDIGMCQASVAAFADLNTIGIISSGAVMVPCPWFLEAAAYCVANPQADMGVHLTLTSEWKTYRWGPISTRDASSGLMDAQGYFHAKSALVAQNAQPDAVAVELNAQIERATREGIVPTHADTHMGSVVHPAFIPLYIQTALSHKLPLMIPRYSIDELKYIIHLDDETAQAAAAMINQLEEMGVPMLDALTGLELDKPLERMAQAKAALKALKPGITHFIIHPSKDTPELRTITKDWQARVGDYETFMDESLLKFIKDEGIHLIGYRALKEKMPTVF